MSERYWITGVQLGMLQAIPDEKERKKMVEEIVDKQFIGDLKVFNKIIDLSKDIQKASFNEPLTEEKK